MNPRLKLTRAIQRNKPLIIFSIEIYFLGLVSGLFLLYFYTPNLSIIQTVGPVENPFASQSEFSILRLIIRNELAMLLMISGTFLLGLTTIINLIFNGFAFGMLISNSLRNGVPLTTVLLLIMPHGIFEFPAIWIAGAAGFKIPYELVRYFTDKKDYILNREEITDFLVLAGVAIVLIIIASVVEASVTMKIGEMIN